MPRSCLETVIRGIYVTARAGLCPSEVSAAEDAAGTAPLGRFVSQLASSSAVASLIRQLEGIHRFGRKSPTSLAC